jgi:diguanylate cyclase (GGDEF)-like protein/PAS domain S-box-containing protein
MTDQPMRYRLTPRLLHQMVMALHAAPDLHRAVQGVIDLVVQFTGFRVAVVSMVRTGGMMETVAVAGDGDAARALLGRQTPISHYEEEFAVAEHWGRLLFVPHDRVPDAQNRGWVPPKPTKQPGRKKTWHPLDALYAPLRSASGDLVGVLSVDLPIGDERPGRNQLEVLEVLAVHAGIALDNARLTEQLRSEEELFRLAFDGTGTGIAIVSLEDGTFGTVIRTNPAYRRLVGRTEAELFGLPYQELLHEDDLPDAARQMKTLVDGEYPSYQAERRFRQPDGSYLWMLVTVSVVRDAEGRPQYAVAQADDISEQRAERDALQHQARHDPLTGLANRAELMERLHESVAHAQVQQHPGVVLFLDLDDFKGINDVHGHLVGDQVLATLAARLAAGVRGGDLAGRMGGDEFLVIADDIDEAGVEELRGRLARALGSPLLLDDQEVRVGVTIGATAIPVDGGDPQALLANADQDMYRRKNYDRQS